MTSTADRFWAKVSVGCLDDCWIWTACRNEDNYGQFRFRGQMQLAHRVAFEFYFGEFDLSKCVLHDCDNPPCCNPWHLFLGTQRENIADRNRKGRTAHTFGERNGRFKLSADYHHEIIRLRLEGATLRELADLYGVSQSLIWLVCNGRA